MNKTLLSLLFTFSILLGCNKDPMENAVAVIRKINGKPTQQIIDKQGEWYKFSMARDTLYYRRKTLRYALEKELNALATDSESSRSEVFRDSYYQSDNYSWETPTYELTIEGRVYHETKEAVLLVWVVRK